MINNAFPGTYAVSTHASCICNELVSLYNRHLVDRTHIGFDLKYFKKITKLVKYNVVPVAPVSMWNIINSYSGSKRNAYMRAKQEVELHNFLPRWAYVKMFVKPDKYPLDDIMNKAPRAIQYRGPHYNLLLAKFLKPIEEAYYSLLSDTGFRFVAKGLNNVERAELLKAQADTFNDPLFIMLDHAAFDSTINEYHLKYTHKLYKRFNSSRFLQMLLRKQLINKGFTKQGIKYLVRGTRMSGDFDTALGNCIVNHLCLLSWLKINGVHGEIILDGDDSIVIVEKAQFHLLDLNHFSKCGFETKMSFTSNISEVEFCQSKYLPTTPPRFSRNPLRALSRLNVSVRDYHGEGWKRYQAAIGLGEMACNQGVPVLYEVGRKLSQLSSKPLHDTETGYKIKVTTSNVVVDDTVRDAYYEAWGITPAQQKLIESTYTPYVRADPELLIQSYYSLAYNAEEAAW